MADTRAALQPEARIRKRIQKLAGALQRLTQLQQPTEREVHELRRSTKKLRAWLKLDPDAAAPAQRLERLLRDNAACHAAARDATVRLQTLARLPALAAAPVPARHPFPVCRDLLAALPLTPAPPLTNAAARRLGTALSRLALQGPALIPEPQLRSGLHTSYRKTRKRLRQARASGKADDLHRFRRWAKYLCYQLELVCRLQRGRLATLQRRLDLLCARLGSWHDVVVLEASLQKLLADCSTAPAAAAQTTREDLLLALKLCRRAAARLHASSLRLAATCFKDKPSRLPFRQRAGARA